MLKRRMNVFVPRWMTTIFLVPEYTLRMSEQIDCIGEDEFGSIIRGGMDGGKQSIFSPWMVYERALANMDGRG
jgi:hypothetical protein